MAWKKRHNYKRGYKAGIKDEKSRTDCRIKEKDKEILDLKLELKLKIKKYEKAIERLRDEKNEAVDNVYKKLADKNAESQLALDKSEELLRGIGVLEIWITQNFQKTMQAGMSFSDGISQKITKFKELQGDIRKSLSKTQTEKTILIDSKGGTNGEKQISN